MRGPLLDETTIHLIDHLLARGWTQRRIASVVGVTQSTVSQIKRRDRRYTDYDGFQADTPAHMIVHQAHMAALVRKLTGKSRKGSKAA